MKANYPITRAVRALRARKIDFSPHLYPYLDHGGTRWAAESLQVSEHAVIKTLVMETDARSPLIVLMHGDCEVSTRQLARALNTKRVTPCETVVAERLTGCQVGGISPLGTRARLAVYGEASIFKLENIFINGGKRGFLIEIDPQALKQVLACREVHVAVCP
jgi:Cys-tRNA(Pro) deacylase